MTINEWVDQVREQLKRQGLRAAEQKLRGAQQIQQVIEAYLKEHPLPVGDPSFPIQVEGAGKKKEVVLTVSFSWLLAALAASEYR